jgi:hypothetical protein
VATDTTLSRWSNVVSVALPWEESSRAFPSAKTAQNWAVTDPKVWVRVGTADAMDGSAWHAANVTPATWDGWTWSYDWTMPEVEPTRYWIQTRAAEDGRFGPVDTITVTLANKTRLIYLPSLLQGWPPLPETPALHAIANPGGETAYTVEWSSVAGATSYVLQEAAKATPPSDADFDPIYEGTSTSRALSGRGAARYHYRVQARNSWGDSAWSNLESVDVLWEMEPNDKALTEANGPLVSGLTYYGTFPSAADKKDYFSFDLSRAHTVDVRLTHIPPGQDYDLALRDSDLEPPIAVSNNSGQADKRITTTVLPPGDYSILVYPYGSGDSTQPYRLRVIYGGAR